MPPYSGPHAAPPIIYIVEFTLRIHHMRHTGLDITHRAMLRTGNVPIAHQRHTVAIDADDAVYDPTGTFDPRQHHIADADIVRLLQDDALPAANDKRQHASPVHRQRHTHVLAHQPHSLVQYHRISNHHDSLLICAQHTFAAASSGRHSRCHTATVEASAFSVSCNPSATRLSHRLPLMLATSEA